MFLQEDWGLLDPSQKELYWDTMLEKYGKVVSLGEDLPSPPMCTSQFLPGSSSFPRGTHPVPHRYEPLTQPCARTGT